MWRRKMGVIVDELLVIRLFGYGRIQALLICFAGHGLTPDSDNYHGCEPIDELYVRIQNDRVKRLRTFPTALPADKPLIHQHFSTIAEPLAEVNRSRNQASSRDALGWLLIPSAEIRRLTHSSGARGELGIGRLSFSVGRMGGESRKSGLQVRLATTGARDRLLIAADQLLEFGSTVVTDIFVNWHRRLAPEIVRFLNSSASRSDWRTIGLAEQSQSQFVDGPGHPGPGFFKIVYQQRKGDAAVRGRVGVTG